MAHGTTDDRGSNFVANKIEEDLASARTGGRIATRFPPEPNGYLHIGHAKSICLNFGLAQTYDGTCNLRFDDTNPETEDPEFVESILADVRWLGFEPTAIFHASDYFGELYAFAEQLIRDGKAYVDDQTLDEIRATRGTVTEPGTLSPWRDRSVDDNLRLLREMRDGAHPEGSRVLRARIDMASPNMKMRDPLMYRIRKAPHYRTGDTWSIYPMYDWAHGQSDALEGITHSVCTLEFENNRELYDWFLRAIGRESLGCAVYPEQTEFARLDLTYTVMSKRKLKRLVEEGHVHGWNDPRMPTLAGFRHRGVRSEAIRTFCDRIGVAKANSTVDVELLEWAIRDDLNHVSPRALAVLEPLKVVLTNVSESDETTVQAAHFPPDVGRAGERTLGLTRELYIDRSDFSVDPPKGWHRLRPGGEVRLRHGWVIRCDDVVVDDRGDVIELRCTADLATLGAPPHGRKVKGTIHWVSAPNSRPARLRLYDRLFRHERPGTQGDFLDELNPDSLQEIEARIEPCLADAEVGTRWQFERQGYFYKVDSSDDTPTFHRIIGLRDSWAKRQDTPKPEAAKTTEPSSSEPKRVRTKKSREQIRAERFDAHPDLAPIYAAYADTLGEADADILTQSPAIADAFKGALGDATDPAPTAKFFIHTVLPAAGDDTPDRWKLTGSHIAELVGLIADKTISEKIARKIVGEILQNGGSPAKVIDTLGLRQITDASAIEAIVADVIARSPGEVERYRSGNKGLVGFFIGQVMKASGGRANPAMTRTVVQKALDAL